GILRLHSIREQKTKKKHAECATQEDHESEGKLESDAERHEMKRSYRIRLQHERVVHGQHKIADRLSHHESCRRFRSGHVVANLIKPQPDGKCIGENVLATEPES